ncbi:hypothetical protein NDI37_07885 [Funiculus sociatus GB2-A5]|uniref:Uncharacterized protein n=1 Tax=Funiculus sociatus GB2-A5 TaxID=2933946 RepID=A0ABV0JLS1_9CYAN|nr:MULTISPECIES: hypothetical protein [unclassified Trichocoleus]MBD1904043.1 hypothetical protein [Trichocoleus sp. FACHB-832]MBD2062814.1 hypothetical protein [Trichocoleus sp. FACHB-6]
MGRSASQSSPTIGNKKAPNRRPSHKGPVKLVTGIYFSVLICTTIGLVMLSSGRMTVGGVPLPIVISFLNDQTARDAYFSGKKTKLHDRLDDMGIEEQMKNFYRPQIPDEAKLDQHIHQILYERTGYVGEQYRVNGQGFLVLKD